MNRQEILDELKKVLAPYTENKELLAGITEDTNLLKDLKINSANLVAFQHSGIRSLEFT